MSEKIIISPDDNVENNKQIELIDQAMQELPEVQAGKNIWQNDFHEFDVFGHTEQFVNKLKEILSIDGEAIDPDLIAAGWLHDIGKPTTAELKMKDGVVQEREPGKTYHDFTDHEIVGADMVRKMNPNLFIQLGLSQEKVAKLVYCHYLPMKGIKDIRKTNNWEDFLEKFTVLNSTLEQMDNTEISDKATKGEILLMFLADKLGQGNPDKYCTDQNELFLIRDALLAENDSVRNDLLKKIYELQKSNFGINKQYTQKKELY